MDLVIPTYGRTKNQVTLKQLVDAGLHCHLVVQAREASEYLHLRDGITKHVLPDNIRTIAPTRQWIIENVGDDRAVVMLDDDLVFYRRRDDDRTKLRDISPGELQWLFTEEMPGALSRYAHVGLASREGANRNTESRIFNTRIMRVLGYRRDILQAMDIRFDEMEVMEDFNVALRLLRLGHDNVVLNDYAHNQSGSGAQGGCSHFRTPELHARNAHRLAELHPGFVKVVEKTTKTAWGGGTRTDVQIAWKKARNS